MNTVAEEMDKSRQDVAPGGADFRAKVPVNNLRERIAAGQARLRVEREAGLIETAALDMQHVGQADEASLLVRDLGLTNTAASRIFIRRVLAMEAEVRVQNEIILALTTQVHSLMDAVEALKAPSKRPAPSLASK
jgi:hypothetical protein